MTQIAGGDAPDVAGVENTPFPQFVDRGILLDVTDLLAATDGFTAEDFFPHLLDRYTYDGRIYGIPTMPSPTPCSITIRRSSTPRAWITPPTIGIGTTCWRRQR